MKYAIELGLKGLRRHPRTMALAANQLLMHVYALPRLPPAVATRSA